MKRKIDAERFQWSLHNWFGHPVSDGLAWLAVGFERIGWHRIADLTDRIGDFIHDKTTPPTGR